MIPVAKVKKPKDFDANVKVPGDQWLKDNATAKRPKALWTPYTKMHISAHRGRRFRLIVDAISV